MHQPTEGRGKAVGEVFAIGVVVDVGGEPPHEVTARVAIRSAMVPRMVSLALTPLPPACYEAAVVQL